MCCRLSDNRVESFVSRMALLGLLDLGARNPRLVTGQSKGSKKQFAYVNKNKQKKCCYLFGQMVFKLYLLNKVLKPHEGT